MRQVEGIWLPDEDKHFEKYAKWMEVGLSKYQRYPIKYALVADTKKTCFIDAGAHIGLWAMQMIEAGYGEVHCFEPVPDNRACLEKNVGGRAKIYPVALGVAGTYKMINYDGRNSGAWECRWSLSGYPDKMKPIDEYDLAPSLIKIDTQGTECDVILGAYETIKKHKPVVLVEQSNSAAALTMLIYSLGYRISHEIRNDYLMVPE